jgi:hypothetical protein
VFDAVVVGALSTAAVTPQVTPDAPPPKAIAPPLCPFALFAVAVPVTSVTVTN